MTSSDFTDIVFHEILCEMKDSLPHSKEMARQQLIEKVSPFISSHTPVPSVLSGFIGVNWPKGEDNDSSLKEKEHVVENLSEKKGECEGSKGEKEETQEEGMDDEYIVRKAFDSMKKYFKSKRDQYSSSSSTPINPTQKLETEDV